MIKQEELDQLLVQLQTLRTFMDSQTRQLSDFTRRLELILSQNHKKIAVRDSAFPTEFSAFCTQLRQQLDTHGEFWQQIRKSVREGIEPSGYSLTLAAKSFFSRAKTLSRACDEFTTSYDTFNRFYKNYTLANLPVWLLTSCCDDFNNLTGRILFLSRELTKQASKK